MKPPRRDFGASAGMKCSECGNRTMIKSRESHPELGARHELQTFVCPYCGATDTRDVFTPAAR
jgi:DNA-directed RNA polymerase subunit RPC12/RpoP